MVLQFEMNPTCVFDRRSEWQIVTSEVDILERSQGGSGLIGHVMNKQENIKIKCTVVEYFWNVTAAYRLTLISGDEIELQTRNSIHAFTSVKVTGGSRDENRIPELPFANSRRSIHEVSMTWLFENIHMADTADRDRMDKVTKVTQFSIDRVALTCRRPSQNDDIKQA